MTTVAGLPVVEPRRRGTALVVPAMVALGIVLGLAVGVAPAPVGGLLLAAVLLTTLLLRLDLAVGVFVLTSLFEGYLAQVDPRATKAVAALVVASWLVVRCRGGGVGLHRVPVVLVASGLWWALLVSTLVNSPVGAAGVLVRWAGFLAVLVVLVDALLRRLLAPETLAQTYVLAAGAAGVLGRWAVRSAEDPRAAGPISDPNDFAFYLLPALPLALALRRPGRRVGAWDVVAGIVVLALAATVSRGAALGLVVMLVVALVARQVRWADLAGLGGLVLLAGSAAAFWQRDLVLQSLVQKTAIAGQNVSERFYLWDAAARMLLERPVLGHGPGSFSAEHGSYATGLPVDTRNELDVAHNTYLEVAAEVGLVGLLLFVALLVVAFVGAWHAWGRGGGTTSRLGAAVASGLLGTSVAACFVTEQYFLPLWLLCALGATLPGLAAPAGQAPEAGESS